MRFIFRSPFVHAELIPVDRDYFMQTHLRDPSCVATPNTILYTGKRSWLLLSTTATRQARGISGLARIISAVVRRTSHANLSHTVDADTGRFFRAGSGPWNAGRATG